MTLLHTTITHLRNLSQVSLNPCGQFNLIHGENGSGKTSILEAIYLLSFGRSFRCQGADSLISYEQSQLTVFAKILGRHGETWPVGVEKHRIAGNSRIRIAEQDARSAAELAKILPLQLINSDSYRILEEGPKFRRQFIDWGVFHVEHSFFGIWQRMQRVLKQRNAALKAQKTDHIQVWDEELIELTNKMTLLRQSYLEKLIPILREIIIPFMPDWALDIDYFLGWNPRQTFEEALTNAFVRDQLLGYTQLGAHRADLRISVENKPATEILSRGQKKILFNALQLAQGLLLKKLTGQSCVYLIDDLPAELDQRTKLQMISILKALEAQVFVTGIEGDELSQLFAQTTMKLFHVEQGVLTEG